MLRSPKLARAFQVDLSAVRLMTTDAQVTIGVGPELVQLPAADVLLICTARRPLDHPRR